jgi:DNA-directed RNA polymerase subunit L
MTKLTYSYVEKKVQVPDKYKHLAEGLLTKYLISVECNASEPMINAIRRTLMDDLEVFRMMLDYIINNNIITDDANILTEDVVGTLRQIVMNQELLDGTEMFQLSVHNKTAGIIPVTTSSLFMNDTPAAGKYVSGNIVITSLEPGRYLKLNNITLVKTTGRIDGNHQVCPPPGFKDNLQDKSSLTHMSTKYNLQIDAIGDFSPKVLLSNVIDVIKNKMKTVHEVLLTRLKEHPPADVINLKVAGETYTMGFLCTFYILKADPTIPFVSNNVIEDMFILKIRKDPTKLPAVINKAFELMLADVPELVHMEK